MSAVVAPTASAVMPAPMAAPVTTSAPTDVNSVLEAFIEIAVEDSGTPDRTVLKDNIRLGCETILDKIHIGRTGGGNPFAGDRLYQFQVMKQECSRIRDPETRDCIPIVMALYGLTTVRPR